MIGRERILAKLAGQPVDCLPLMPITMMFAAQQHGVTYLDYVSDFNVLADAQVRVAEKFGFDYVSVISDPAREPCDLGAAIEFFPDQPPATIEEQSLLKDKARLLELRVPEPMDGRRMSDRVNGVALLKRRVGSELLVEGWVEGPCAEAADLRGINRLMIDLNDDPAFVRDLFDFCVRMEVAFARAQVDAGADIIGIGDAAASLIGPFRYEEFVEPYERQLIDAIHAMGARTRLHICGNAKKLLNGMARVGASLIDLDHPVPVSLARAVMGPAQPILGNLDPVSQLRDGTPDSVRQEVARCHAEAGSAYIVGAGCEICRDTPEENFRAMCDYARNAS